ncbi:hypothetical protein BESB_053280 [Besnoitia besnoiti]|uniref:Uncharacterized protein n=1 Tax=Besnoitia besnoiti TaxID=94643 RepID=A0A2A9MJA2_BESBE|nr:hypothetical protein BESB_053280 [Besnoitia besnoiti]PFH35677.1 hypothetical protein BESB_053280 [Besnoitia besnoiti]
MAPPRFFYSDRLLGRRVDRDAVASSSFLSLLPSSSASPLSGVYSPSLPASFPSRLLLRAAETSRRSRREVGSLSSPSFPAAAQGRPVSLEGLRRDAYASPLGRADAKQAAAAMPAFRFPSFLVSSPSPLLTWTNGNARMARIPAYAFPCLPSTSASLSRRARRGEACLGFLRASSSVSCPASALGSSRFSSFRAFSSSAMTASPASPSASASPLFLEKFLGENERSGASAFSTPPRVQAPPLSLAARPSASAGGSSSPLSSSASPPPGAASAAYSSASAASSFASESSRAPASVDQPRPLFFAYGASKEVQLRAVLPLLESSTDPLFVTSLLLSLHALLHVWPLVLASPELRACSLVFPLLPASPPASSAPSAPLYASFLAQFGVREAHVEGLLAAAGASALDLLLLLSLLPHVSLAQQPPARYQPTFLAPNGEPATAGADAARETDAQEEAPQLMRVSLRDALPLLLAAFHPQRPGVDRDLTSRLVSHFTQASLLLLPPLPPRAPASSASSAGEVATGEDAARVASRRSLAQPPPPRAASSPVVSPSIAPELALWHQHTVLSLTPQTLRFIPQLPVRLAAALHAARVRLPLLPSPLPLPALAPPPVASAGGLAPAGSPATPGLPPAAGKARAPRAWSFGKPREEDELSAAGVAQWEVVDQVGAVVLLNQLDVVEDLIWKINWSRLSVSATCRFFREVFDSRHLVLSGLAMQKAFASLSSRFGMLQLPDIANLLHGIQSLQRVTPQEQREIVCSSAACLSLMWPHAHRFLPLFSLDELTFACEVFAHEVFIAAVAASGAHRMKTLSFRRLAVECRRQECYAAFFAQEGEAWKQLLDALVARRESWSLQSWIRFLKMLDPLVSLHQLRNEALCAPFSRTLAPPSPLVARVHQLLCVGFGAPEFVDRLVSPLPQAGKQTRDAIAEENLAVLRRHLATLSLHEIIDFLVGFRTYGYVNRPLQRVALTEAVRRVEEDNWSLTPEDLCRLIVASEDLVLGNPIRRVIDQQLRQLSLDTEDLAALMALVVALERQPALGVAALFDLRKHIDSRVAGLTAAVGEGDVAYAVSAESPMTTSMSSAAPKLPLSLLPLLFVYLFSRPSSLTASSSLLPRGSGAAASFAVASSPSSSTFLSPLSSFLRTLIPELLSPFLSALDLAMLLAPLCTTEAPLSCYASHFPTTAALPPFVRFRHEASSGGSRPPVEHALGGGGEGAGEEASAAQQSAAACGFAASSLSVSEAANARFSGNVALVRRLCRAARDAVPYTPLALLRVATGHAILHAHANHMLVVARATHKPSPEAANDEQDLARLNANHANKVIKGVLGNAKAAGADPPAGAGDGIAADLALGHLPTLLRMLRLLEMDSDTGHLQRLLNVLLVADLSLLTPHRLLDLMEAFVAARTRLGPVLQRLLSWFGDHLLRTAPPSACLLDSLLAEIALCAATLDFAHPAFQRAAVERLRMLQIAMQASPAASEVEASGGAYASEPSFSRPQGLDEGEHNALQYEIAPAEALRIQIRILLGLAPVTPMTKNLADHFRFCVRRVAERVEVARQRKEEISVRDEDLTGLYEFYLCLLLRGPSHLHLQETDPEDKEMINFLLQDLPRLKWLERERARTASFRLTEESRQISAALRRRGLESMKPVITGICFCHFASVSAPREGAARGPTGVAVLCVPEEETLASWTVDEGCADDALLDRGDGGRLVTRSEDTDENLSAKREAELAGRSTEHIARERWEDRLAAWNANPLLPFGESRKRIAHLKKAGWVVLPLFLTQWRQLRSDYERDEFLRCLINLS